MSSTRGAHSRAEADAEDELLVTAAVSRTPGAALELESLVLAPLRDDELLVRLVATGICHTDVAMRDSPDRVPRPIVLGHEGAGVVERAGRSVQHVRPGDHVVLTFASCGACSTCLAGAPAYCRSIGALNFGGSRSDGSTAWRARDLDATGRRRSRATSAVQRSRVASAGAVQPTHVHSHFFGQSSFATHTLCGARSAVPVPHDLPLERLGPLGCGIQTGAGAVLNSLSVRPGQGLVVLGTGAVGLAAVMAARGAGAAPIVAVDVRAERLALAQQMGASHVIDAGATDLAEALGAIAPGGIDFALDTSGSVEAIRTAVAALAPRGTIGLVSAAKGQPIPLGALPLMLGGRSVRGIHQGDSVPPLFIARLIELHRRGDLPFERLIRFYDFAHINEAMDDLACGRVVKPVLRMPGARGRAGQARRRVRPAAERG